jgi:uncharacterized protein involved in outer membrane biogenesis
VQTTLLGLGIAVILALVAALVGPHFVNWSDYRAVFEEHAGKAIGAPVRIAGKIDARLLPIPSLTLRGLETQNAAGPVRVREAFVEFSLGALMRGQWRATEARIAGLELSAGLDAGGRIVGAIAAPGLDADAVAIERFRVDDGRITLTDARSNSQFVIEQFWFGGDMRSLAGPVRGEGGGLSRGERFGYRVALGKPGEEGARLRLVVEPVSRPLSAEVDGSLRQDNGTLRFDGALSLARLAIAGEANSENEAWKLTSRVKADAANALFEQMELQYGPLERAVKLTGTADLKFGATPQLDAVLSARQVDLDRLAASPEGVRPPMAVLRALADGLGEGARPPLPVRIGIGIDQITLASGTIQNFRGDFISGADGWDVEGLEFRAPGFAHVRASGRLQSRGGDADFSGPVAIEATEPRLLSAWLEGRRAAPGTRTGPLRASGDVAISSTRLAVERLRAEIDRKPIAGRFVLADTAQGRRRLEADLNAAAIDLDAVEALTKAMGAELRLPDEMALSLDLGRVSYAGVEARGAKAKLGLDADRLAIEKLTIDDLSGAALDISGNLQGPWERPKGALVLNLGGPKLEGVAALLSQAFPSLEDTLRRIAPQLSPARLRVTVAIATPQETIVSAKIDGTAGALRVAAGLSANGAATNWRQATIESDGRLETADSRGLARLINIDRAFAVNQTAGAFSWKVNGAAGADVRVQSTVALAGLEASLNGTLRSLADGLAGQGDLSVKAADAIALRTIPGRQTPLTFRTTIKLEPQRYLVETLSGSLAGSPFSGRLRFTRDLGALDGRIETDFVDASALLGALLGAPASKDAALWSAQPFAERLLAGVDGAIELQAKRAAFAPAIEVRQLQGRLRFSDSLVAFEDVTGTLAGGKLIANFSAPISPLGVNAEFRIGVSGADVAAFYPGGRAPLGGRASLQIEAKSFGRSAASLVAGLNGSGSVSIEQAALSSLDPGVFDAIDAAPDQVEVGKVKALVEAALIRGALRIARADAALALSGGQLRLSNLIAKGDRASLLLSGGVDLIESNLDARLTLFTDSLADSTGRPEINVLLRGPIAAPQRSIDVSALVGWLALRAVDRQAKRLETLEAERAAAEAALQKMEATPVSAPPSPSVPTPLAPAPNAQPNIAIQPNAAAPSSRSLPMPTRRPPSPASEPATEIQQPADIRSQPARRPSAAQDLPERLPAPASPPPRQRSLFDLFGAAR